MAFTIKLTSSVERVNDGSGDVVLHLQLYSDGVLVGGLPEALRVDAADLQNVIAQPTLAQKKAAFVAMIQNVYPDQFGTQALQARIAGNQASKAAADAFDTLIRVYPFEFEV